MTTLQFRLLVRGHGHHRWSLPEGIWLAVLIYKGAFDVATDCLFAAHMHKPSHS